MKKNIEVGELVKCCGSMHNILGVVFKVEKYSIIHVPTFHIMTTKGIMVLNATSVRRIHENW